MTAAVHPGRGGPMAPPPGAGASARLVLLPTACDLDGEMRVAVLPAGPRAVPIVYADMAAALAALHRMEAL
ncbi:hypothetical protein [Dankookia sp. P2]|uniref:hypothetical protein n=1 Tax=Dankookia sp. P2 TaxID=3423955 RepID=UPI003D668760